MITYTLVMMLIAPLPTSIVAIEDFTSKDACEARMQQASKSIKNKDMSPYEFKCIER